MCERRADGHIRTTEWEEIQYKHGNKIGQYEDNELAIVAQKLAERHVDAPLEAHDRVRERMRDRELRGHDHGEDEYDEDRDMAAAVLEGEDDEDDVIARFRAARVRALQEQQERDRFGRVKGISGANYVGEITEASKDCWVVGALVEQNHDGCLDLLHAFEALAARHPHVKFVSCKSTEAIPNFPAKHLPCVVVYNECQMQSQLTGMDPWCRAGSKKPSAESVEAGLRKVGVLPPLPREDEEDDDPNGLMPKGKKAMLNYRK